MSNKEKEKTLLFSLLPGRDLIFRTMRGSGKGGQNRNKLETKVTLTHPESEITVKAEDERSQLQNKRQALKRLADHPKFKIWLKMKSAAIHAGFRTLEEKIEKTIEPTNLKIENITRFTCDSCRKTSVVTQKGESDNLSVPKGWIQEEDDRHLCMKCSRKR